MSTFLFLHFRFVLPGNPSWPFPIIGTTLVGPLLNAPYGEKNHNYTRIDITPLYVGQLKTSIVVYKYLFNLLKRTIQIGGAIESFAFARTGQYAQYFCIVFLFYIYCFCPTASSPYNISSLLLFTLSSFFSSSSPLPPSRHSPLSIPPNPPPFPTPTPPPAPPPSPYFFVTTTTTTTGRAPFLGLPTDMRTAIVPGIPDPDTVFDLMYAVGASSYAPGKIYKMRY